MRAGVARSRSPLVDERLQLEEVRGGDLQFGEGVRHGVADSRLFGARRQPNLREKVGQRLVCSSDLFQGDGKLGRELLIHPRIVRFPAPSVQSGRVGITRS